MPGNNKPSINAACIFTERQRQVYTCCAGYCEVPRTSDDSAWQMQTRLSVLCAASPHVLLTAAAASRQAAAATCPSLTHAPAGAHRQPSTLEVTENARLVSLLSCCKRYSLAYCASATSFCVLPLNLSWHTWRLLHTCVCNRRIGHAVAPQCHVLK
jgi:hypothetical protein